MPSILAFDSLEFSKTLQNAGMQQDLAEILSKNQGKILEDAFASKEFATKTDLQLETEKTRAEIRADIEKLCGNIKAENEKLRGDVRADIEKLRGDFGVEQEKNRTEIERAKNSTLAI